MSADEESEGGFSVSSEDNGETRARGRRPDRDPGHMDKAVAKFVKTHEGEVEVLENGKIKFIASGKVVPPIGKLLTRYSESDKYKRALQRLLLDLTPYEPFFINLPDQPSKVWCTVTGMTVNKDISAIERHQQGELFNTMQLMVDKPIMPDDADARNDILALAMAARSQKGRSDGGSYGGGDRGGRGGRGGRKRRHSLDDRSSRKRSRRERSPDLTRASAFTRALHAKAKGKSPPPLDADVLAERKKRTNRRGRGGSRGGGRGGGGGGGGDGKPKGSGKARAPGSSRGKPRGGARPSASTRGKRTGKKARHFTGRAARRSREAKKRIADGGGGGGGGES